jgi:hypothetical protein
MARPATAETAYPFRVTAGVFLIALLGAAAALETVQFVRQYNRGFRDPYQITKQEARFAAVKAALPPDQEIGYVSDKAQGDPQGGAMFFGAQYVLAPKILVREPGTKQHRYVLGNFTSKSDFAEVARLAGMSLVIDAGEGVVLFKREQLAPEAQH